MLNPTRKKKIFPPVFPNDPVGAEFCKWFWSLNKGWNWISSDLPTPGSKARWITEPYPIQPDEQWQQHQDPRSLVGVGFKDLTRYLNLDIDRRSEFHPLNDPAKFAELLRVLRLIGLNSPVVIRSSWSEGLHVYFPLPRAISSFGLACAVKWTLFDHGIILASGQIETFPNTKSYGSDGDFVQYKCHRLPLQPSSGSFLLDAMLEPYSDSVEDLLDEFNAALALQDLKLLKPVMWASWKRQSQSRGFGGSDRASSWRRHLERRTSNGWTGFSQTNSLIKDIATYGRVFVRLSGRALINYTVETALSAPGYEQFCRHQGEIGLRAKDWCRCVEAYYWPYGSDPSREGTYAEHFNRDYESDCPRPENNIVDFGVNSKRSLEAHERIKQALAYLESQGVLPTTATARSQAIIAAAKVLTGTGISQRTLHKPKYLPLWHPAHYLTRAQECKIDRPEPVTASLESVAYPVEPDPWLESSAVETQHRQGLTDNFTPPPYMKGLGVLCLPPASAAPQAQADAPDSSESDSNLLTDAPDSSESENLLKSDEALTHKEILCQANSGVVDFDDNSSLSVERTGMTDSRHLPTAPTAPVPTEPAAPLDFRRVAMLRVQALAYAQRSVKNQELTKERLIRGTERAHLSQVARMQFYWESGSPQLRAEAKAWAAANPGVLPGVGPSDPPAIAPKPAAIAPGLGSAPAAHVPSPKSEPLKVGSRIIWDNCPAHCASWNPFTIIRINDCMAWLDVYERPVPLSELRRAP